MKISKGNDAGKTLWKLVLGGVLAVSLFCGQASLAVTDYLFFSINGDTSLTALTQGDSFAWGANCAVGADIQWEIWYDVDSDSVLDPGGDVLVESFTATDGDTLSDGPPPDINPIADGWYQSSPMILGLAAGTYIFTAMDLTDSTSAMRAILNTEMISPPNQVRGHITVPGHSAPDPILENIWIDAEVYEENVGFYSTLTDDNGYYEINIGDIGTGLTFEIQPADVSGYVNPGYQSVVVSGIVSNVDFVFQLSADSVYGFFMDDVGATILSQNWAYCRPRFVGPSEREAQTIDGRYVINFSASELGEWELGVWSDNLIPTYLIPYQIIFSHDTLGSFQHDFVCTRTDSYLYVRVTENGALPAHNYRVSASSASLASSTQGVSGTGADNLLALSVSTLDASGWNVWVNIWDDQYPIPAGYVLEPGLTNNRAPGDTVSLNFISGYMVGGTVTQDPEDAPIDWNDVWIGLYTEGKNYGTNVGGGGVFTAYADADTYTMTCNADGYLSDPQWRNVVVTGDIPSGQDFTINATHCRVTGTLTNVTTPLSSSNIWVSVRTGSGADGYQTGATVDSLSGTYTFWLCDGDWTIQPPYIDGFISPASVLVTVGEIPDTVKTVNLVYTVAGCCGLYTAGFTGNTDCNPDGKRNIADITRLIDRVYLSKTPLCCEENGNIDGDIDSKLNIADITRLIDNVYLSKAQTAICQ